MVLPPLQLEYVSDEVDIIKLINVSSQDQGVSLVEGPIRKFPAYKFRLPYGNVPLLNSTAVTAAMNNPNGFTVVFLIRQQKNNLGTLVSVNSPGRLTPWFQLTSNSKTGSLTLKYRVQGSNRLRQIDWGLPKHHRKSPLAGQYKFLFISIFFIYCGLFQPGLGYPCLLILERARSVWIWTAIQVVSSR